MKKTGFLISKNASSDAFFTTSSAYDRPQWVSLSEATVYHTAELADAAAKKLWKYGAYQANVKSLAEAYGDEGETDLDGISAMGAAEDDLPSDDMGPCPECGEESCVCDPDAMGSEGECPDCQCDPCECEMTGDPDSMGAGCECPDCQCDPCECDLDGEFADDAGSDGVSMELEMPDDMDSDSEADPMADAEMMLTMRRPTTESKNEEGDRVFQTYAAWKRAVKAINPNAEFYGDKDIGGAKGIGEWDGETGVIFNAATRDGYAKKAKGTQLDETVSQAHDAKISVPANVKSALTTTIADFKKEAKSFETRDTDRASFCLTVVAALEQLLDDLSQGTVAGVKQAQIHMTSYMNPITTHIPPVVIKFIARGGEKETLGDLFGAKWQERKYSDVV